MTSVDEGDVVIIRVYRRPEGARLELVISEALLRRAATEGVAVAPRGESVIVLDIVGGASMGIAEALITRA